MSHEIHTSERRSFRGCRRRWNWAYRDGFVPRISPRPLEFGVAYHKAMEKFYDPELWSWPADRRLSMAIELFEQECEKQKQRYLDLEMLTELPFEVEQDYDARVALGEGMLRYHATWVHPKYDGWFKPIATEVNFEVPIEDPTYDTAAAKLHCTSSPGCGQNHSNDPYSDDSLVVYAGRVDLLVEDIRNGGYFIWDHKTASALTNDDGFLQLDDQVGSYCWALRTVLNIDVRGFIYAESRKDYPRPPKLLKRQSGGRAFSTAQNQATSLEIFEPFVAKHDPDAFNSGAYDDYLSYLKSAEATQYHQRFVIVKSERELTNIGRNIALEAADMVDSSTRIYPSVGRYTCSTCAYRQPCLSMFMDEDVDYQFETNYLQTDRRYWMEQPRSSEKSAK